MSTVFATSPNVTPANILAVPANGFADQNLTLMMPLYTGGRLQALIRAASGREKAAEEGIATAKADAALMVKEAYYRALFAAEMAKVAEARKSAAQALVDVTRAQFEAGKGIQASVARAESELADAQRMQTSARNDQAKMLLDLKHAMGVHPDSAITLSDLLSFNQAAGDLNSSLQEASRARPELQAARARVDAARAQSGAARASYQPQIYAAAMADLFAPSSAGRNTGGTIGVTISIPLVDGGQRRAEIGSAQAMQRRSEAELASAELRVGTEVRVAWLDIDTAAQNYRTAQAAVRSAQETYDVVMLRVQNQKAILVEQLDALAALTQTKTNLTQALYENAVAAARLQRAIGRP
jgi:outer membrane protein